MQKGGVDMYGMTQREITKEQYDKIVAKEMKMYELFSEAERMGYGALPHGVFEKDGKYFVSYSISDSCD